MHTHLLKAAQPQPATLHVHVGIMGYYDLALRPNPSRQRCPSTTYAIMIFFNKNNSPFPTSAPTTSVFIHTATRERLSGTWSISSIPDGVPTKEGR